MISAEPGHSTAAHLLLGECAKCPGRNSQDEVRAWRRWASVNVPEVATLAGPAPQRED